MKYAFITFAIVMMAAALSSSSNNHAGALPRRLIRRAMDITQCFKGLAFDGACKEQFKPGGIFTAVRAIRLTSLALDFTDPNPLKVTLSSPEMLVDVIPGLPVTITSTRQDVILVDNGVEIAKFSTPWVDGVMEGDILRTTVGITALDVIDASRDQFSAFISSLTSNAKHTFTLKGTVDVKLTIATPSAPIPFRSFAPSITITGIYFESEVTLDGFANFPDIQYEGLLEKSENADGSFTVKSKVNIKNVSQLSVKMGDVQFNTFDAISSEAIGVTVFEQLTLEHGDNHIIAVTTSTSATKNPHEIYKRVTENGETFRFEGSLESSKNDPILAKGISVVKTSVKVPVLNTPAPAS
ncbi:MAG: hypothetical protein JOS17DRAFT_826571 [Linnemannia elongata]|nr:MAG: hypothetical protein JOS17DRAFT_826571 [Linnemannia elongata]